MLSSAVLIKHGTTCLFKCSSTSRRSGNNLHRHSSCVYKQLFFRSRRHVQLQLRLQQKTMTSATGNPGARETVDERLESIMNHSWVEKLNPDPETEANAPNKTSRRVKSGHFVRVKPTPLKHPALIIHPKRYSRISDYVKATNHPTRSCVSFPAIPTLYQE